MKMSAKIISPKILILACIVLAMPSCKSKVEQQEMVIESEGVDITVEVKYWKTFKSGITGAPHAPIVIPYAGFDKGFTIIVQPEGRDSLYTEVNPADISLNGIDIVESTIPTIDVKLSPNLEHLMYQRVGEDTTVVFLIHYLAKKHPFGSPYHIQQLSFENPAWDELPSINSIVRRMLADTTSIFNTALEKHIHTGSQSQLFDAMEKLPAENEYDFLAIQVIDHKDDAMKRISTLSRDWNNRSDKWQNAIKEKLESMYKYAEQTANYHYFARNEKAIYQIANYSGDGAIKKTYQEFLVANFRHGMTNTIGVLMQRDSMVAKTYRKEIAAECRKLLALKDPAETTHVLYISGFLGDDKLRAETLEQAIELWPAHPIGSYIKSYKFTEAQQATLIAKSLSLVDSGASSGGDGVFHAYDMLERWYDCDSLKQLAKKYPNFIEVRYSCPKDTAG